MKWMSKFRPQVLAVIIVLAIGLVLSLTNGYVEVATACIGVMGPLAVKLVDKD